MPQVIMDRAYTYEIDNARQRTLPRGWRGEVEKDVAAKIKKGGFGRVLGARAAAKKAADSEGGGAKKAADSQGGGAKKAADSQGGGGE